MRHLRAFDPGFQLRDLRIELGILAHHDDVRPCSGVAGRRGI